MAWAPMLDVARKMGVDDATLKSLPKEFSEKIKRLVDVADNNKTANFILSEFMKFFETVLMIDDGSAIADRLTKSLQQFDQEFMNQIMILQTSSAQIDAHAKKVATLQRQIKDILT